MASNKTSFKGFTFRKTGSNVPAPNPGPPTIPAAGPSHTNRLHKVPPISNATLPASQATSSKSFNVHPPISSFAKNRQVAVAAVLPQRPIPIAPPILKEHIPLKSNEDCPLEITDDDDDDFEIPVFSQKTPSKLSRKTTSGYKFKMIDKEKSDDEEVNFKPKRRRINPVIESNSEDEITHQEISISQTTSTPSNTPVTTFLTDVCQHPLLQRKDVSAISDMEVVTFRDILLQVIDEVCEIVCQIKMGDLMNLVSADYDRLQKLLTVRKQIKDIGVVDIDKAVQEANCSFSYSSYIDKTTNTRKRFLNSSQEPKSSSTPISFRTPNGSSSVAAGSGTNRTSAKSLSTKPSIPCGDSFFEKKEFNKSQTARPKDGRASLSSDKFDNGSRLATEARNDSLTCEWNSSPSSKNHRISHSVNKVASVNSEKDNNSTCEWKSTPTLKKLLDDRISQSINRVALAIIEKDHSNCEWNKTPTSKRQPSDSISQSFNRAASSGDNVSQSFNRGASSGDNVSQSFNRAASSGDNVSQSFNRGASSGDNISQSFNRVASSGDNISQSFNRAASSSNNYTSVLNNSKSSDKSVDYSWNSVENMDDEDFADEMEAAFEFDDTDEVVNNSFGSSRQSYNSSKVVTENTKRPERETAVVNIVPSSQKKTTKQEQSEKQSRKTAASTSNSNLYEKDVDCLYDEAVPIDDDDFGYIHKDNRQTDSSQDNRFEDAEYTAVFSSSDRDDGASPEFAGMHFDHSPVLQDMFRQVFGLKEFRHNQLPAINAALLGQDCFILMPTGGGKSLCYQLPALVANGVSIIISPLKALIQDQTQRLLSLDIPATHLSSDVETGQSQSVYSGLYQRTPAFKMLYVTPEKLSASEKLLSCLDNLYRRQLLNRFVIDEAHCVSQWGHDFRPDYKRLNVLRQRFPGVPMMALTATATPRVRKDIIHQLAMTNPKWFMQSFNRPNLKYSVQNKKPSNATTDVIDIIKAKFPRDSGIVYCLSRKECDNVAGELRKAGLQAEPYHAGLDDNTRAKVQDRWLNDDRCKVICATIAFGMGIDKADVRFVIHYSLPKSVEGYYQEAGRAGRDGLLSYCIMLYTYQDVKRLRRMIETDQSANFESKRVHIDNLFRMVSYCENVSDCRRCQILQYFGECSFARDMCSSVKGALCDNCEIKDSFSLRDVTAEAKEIVKCVKELNAGGRGNYTLIHILEVFKGSNNTKIQNLGHSKLALHSRGKDWARNDAERLCRKLVIDGILKEDLLITSQDHAVCYVRLGHRAADLMLNKLKVELPIQGGRKRNDVAKVGTEPANSREKLELECLAELRTMAKSIAAEHGMKNYALLFPESALKQLAQSTPITREEMIEQIDHFNATIIDKYQADRLLDITLKYSMELAVFDESDALENTHDGDNRNTSNGEWASHYFEEPSSSAGRGRKGGRGRGGKRRFTPKGRGGFMRGKSKGKKPGKSAGKQVPGKKQDCSTSLSEYKYNKTTSGNYTAPARAPAAVTKASLGLMPDPRARSFLSSFPKAGGNSAFF